MSGADPPSIVVAVVPREKFGYAETTLEALLENTKLPFELLYIDGNAPASVRSAVERRLSGRPNTRIIRCDHFLGPLQSRSIAIREARPDAEYLVILDNDVFVRPNWLGALLRCAREEGAGAVVPCVLIGPPDSNEIHHVGGDSSVVIQSGLGEVELHHYQHLEYQRLDDVREELGRRDTLLLEDHCIFATTQLWRSLQPLDETVPLMASVPELSHRFQQTGARLMVEPAAEVVYLWGADVPLKLSDLPFWYWAWSEKWSRYAMRQLASRLGLTKSQDQTRSVVWWLNNHRRLPLFPWIMPVRVFFDDLGLHGAGKGLIKGFEIVEDLFAMVVAEVVRLTPAGGATGCPPLFSRYPRVGSRRQS